MWINVPSTISPFAQVELASTSDWNWLWEAFAQSVGWSGKPSPSTTWSRRWKRDAWLNRLSGRIAEPSTADRGVASWIRSLRDTRASRSVSPANVAEKTILGTYGRTSLELLAKWNRQSCFSKTCPAILASASRKLPVIFKQWVMKLRQDSLRRRKSALVTGESGFSLWRSPTAYQPGVDVNKLTTKDGNPATTVDQRLYLDGLHRTVGLRQQVALWPTPDVPNGGRTVPQEQMTAGMTATGRKVQKPLARTAQLWPSPIATETRQGFQNRTRGKKGTQESLTTRTLLWPTPRTITGGAESAERKQELGRKDSGGGDLQAAAKAWATPTASTATGGTPQNSKGKRDLRLDIRQWPTPRTSDYKSGQVTDKTFSKNARPLNEVACHCSRLDLDYEKYGEKPSPSTRRLNPRFVTWLMGWPLTDSGFSATEWSRYRRRMRSSLCCLLCDSMQRRDT